MIATISVAGALVTSCGDEWQAAELDPGQLEQRDQPKTEEHNPPAPPTPPGQQADEDEDLVKKGKPKKSKDIGPADIEGQYIVRMKKGGNPKAAAAAVQANPKHVFTKVVPGFAGPLNQGQLKKLQERGDVELIEPDQLVSSVTTQAMDANGQPAGLDRIDQHARPLDKRYIYFRNAYGVRAYILDTGIQTNHPDLPNALAMFDAFGGNGQDCNGHGTHVAGIVGGNTHGVAKQVLLRGVRVMGCNGYGTWSGVLAGLDWVAKNHIKPAVANLSLTGGYSSTVNAAVNNLANAGVFVVVAAGNKGQDSCDYSPPSAANVFAVAASDINDNRATFSNYGACVSAYAPGVNIRSDWIGSSTKIMSGTSMAAPHVTGTVALYKAVYGDASFAEIKADLLTWSTPNVIIGNLGGTDNILIYQPF